MNTKEPKTLNFKNIEEDIPALSKSGMIAFELLKLTHTHQVDSGFDHSNNIRLNGNICSVIKYDYVAPETCEGDYNETLYDGCDFSISLLYDALSRITPGGKEIVYGRAIFRREYHKWGFSWDEINDETIEEEDITIVLELSSNAREVALVVQRNKGIYETIKRWGQILQQPSKKKFKQRRMDK
jgi:hypothetical protein